MGSGEGVVGRKRVYGEVWNRYNVMMLWLCMGIKLSRVDSFGGRKGRGGNRWIGMWWMKLHMRINVRVIGKGKCGGGAWMDGWIWIWIWRWMWMWM